MKTKNRKKLTFLNNIIDLVDLFRPLKLPKTQKNKILIFNWRDKKHVWAGGAEIYIDELLKRWIEKGNYVLLFCGNDGNGKRIEIRNGLTIIRRGGFYTVYLWAALYYIFKLRGKFDVIVDSENGIPFFTPLFSTKPVILLIHHVHQEIFIEFVKFPLSHIARFIEGKLIPLVYRKKPVITVSESSKTEIVKAGIAGEERISVVNPGINIPNYRYTKNSHPTFIYLGRLKAYKNIDIAIKAFRLIVKKFRNSKLWIVGEGDSFDSLKKLVDELNLNGKVNFFGKVGERKKIKLLSKSWAAFQPSSVEGWGITVLEANACKTPVIASKTNGLIDSVIDHKTGFLIKLKEPYELYKASLTIIRNKKLRERMSREAYNWSHQFGWDKSAVKFINVISNSVSEKKQAVSVSRAGLILNRIVSIFY